MQDDFEEAHEDFVVMLDELNFRKHGYIAFAKATGDHIYNSSEKLFWFGHVVFYDTCTGDCKGHRYWGCHVDHLREFDVLEDIPPHLLGYRVVSDPTEALDGSWADGGTGHAD